MVGGRIYGTSVLERGHDPGSRARGAAEAKEYSRREVLHCQCDTVLISCSRLPLSLGIDWGLLGRC